MEPFALVGSRSKTGRYIISATLRNQYDVITLAALEGVHGLKLSTERGLVTLTALAAAGRPAAQVALLMQFARDLDIAARWWGARVEVYHPDYWLGWETLDTMTKQDCKAQRGQCVRLQLRIATRRNETCC